MRILINDYGGHPFPAQLSRRLAARGHNVLHAYCRSYVSGKGGLRRAATDAAELAFVALDLGAPFAKHSMLRRFRQERHYARLLISEARSFKPDVVISATMPLFAQETLLSWARRNRVAFVFWLQDLTSVAMNAELARRFGRPSMALRAYISALEARLLRSSDAVVVITEDFLPTLSRWGIRRAKTMVIPNWAPLDELPQLRRVNPWAEEHGLDTKFTFLYAGTLGLKHDPELLVQLSLGLRGQGDVAVVVASEGVGADHCAARAAEEGLSNLVVLPFQPYERFPEMLASADVLVAVLEEKAGVFSVPSKILAYLCAGRPILAAVPPDNQATRVIRESGAGLVVAPADRSGFVDAAQRLLHDEALRARCSRRARQYAEAAFDIAAITDRFENMMLEVSGAGHGRETATEPVTGLRRVADK